MEFDRYFQGSAAGIVVIHTVVAAETEATGLVAENIWSEFEVDNIVVAGIENTIDIYFAMVVVVAVVEVEILAESEAEIVVEVEAETDFVEQFAKAFEKVVELKQNEGYLAIEIGLRLAHFEVRRFLEVFQAGLVVLGSKIY